MKRSKRVGIVLTLFFSIVIFTLLVLTIVITVGIFYFLYSRGYVHPNISGEGDFRFPFLLLAVISILVGTVLTLLVGSIPLRPLQDMLEGLQKLAGGDYSVRLKVLSLPMNRDIVNTFNTLAQELEHTEMFRSDFINNFSHEFKTPIVSILGFARLLRRGNLSKEEENEYLEIIEQESERLSELATNVLDLTKVENQEILTDVTDFNLSEQIRDCVLLLEKKWTQKNLTPDLEFSECMISANEELLKQVWINLLDNTIKYSPEGGTFEVRIQHEGNSLIVQFKNYGPQIDEKDLPLIMNKFYQADTSHASEGNGIGLAIVKRVVELHGGSVGVKSGEHETVFSVMLPQ